jgi:predicted TIM-barrel fold metal-dependent hydrolase
MGNKKMSWTGSKINRRDMFRLFYGIAATFAAAHFWPLNWAVASGNPSIKKSSFPKPNSIDVHHHLVPDFYRKALSALNIKTSAGFPLPAWSPLQSQRLMNNLEIRTAILSISSPGIHFGDDAAARDISRQSNEYCARLISDNPSRFGAFAVLPLPDVNGSLKEAEYALDTLKLDGVVMLASHIDGTFLGDNKYDDLLAELDKRKTVVFIHPTTHPTSKELQLNIPEGIIEFPFDTSRAAFNLVWTGAAERYSNIRYILSHAGGTVPFLAWRFSLLEYDYRFRKRAPLGPMAYLKSFYYDLALSANPYALRSLQELVGPEQVLYGSDNPFANSYLVANGIDFIKKYDGYSEEDRKLIFRSNALKLFPRLQRLAES